MLFLINKKKIGSKKVLSVPAPQICIAALDSFIIVLLPENLHAYFELSAQAWILYKAPQWNARYPNSCPERIKL
jgi:hypothetical protein